MYKPNMWIIRVGNGENFRNSKFSFWAVKRGRGNCIKSIVENRMNKGDILWFMTSKQYGGKLIGMSEYNNFYDIQDESNTLNNQKQNWKGDDSWDIQIHYNNLYNTEKQNIFVCIQCSAIILKYYTFKDKIDIDLYKHYTNFKFYGVPDTSLPDKIKQKCQQMIEKLKKNNIDKEQILELINTVYDRN